MTDKEKIVLVDRLIEDLRADIPQHMKVVGYLTQKQGIRGYKPCEPGTPILQKGDRYILVMETLSGTGSAEIPYYMDTLAPHISKEPICNPQ